MCVSRELLVSSRSFELTGFTAAQTCAIERQEERSVIEILRARNQALNLVATHVAPFQDIAAEKSKRADLRDDRPDGEPPLLEEEQVVAPELRRREPIEARARVLAKRLNDLDVTADGRSGVVVTHQLVAQALE